MSSTNTTAITLPYAADFHVHLRQGDMMRLVTPTVRQGGVNVAYVMPNLVPPITTTEQALKYKAELEAIEPRVTYLMTLYLSPELTPDEIRKAAAAGIAGVKSYPRGVTTNSDAGIESYEMYYPVFEAMQECDMVLNLHGEAPSDADKGICVLNAEETFLPWLRKITGDTVGCTITAHHLSLIVDDWAGKNHRFCKPVAKYPYDRNALREVVAQDSAPHTRETKECAHACAGVFTSPDLIPYVASVFDEIGALDKLKGFVCDFGRRFYRIPQPAANETIQLVRTDTAVADVYAAGPLTVVPFRAGEAIGWQLKA
ncbi:dihydroorotase, homodimeric type [Syncephalis plumigaleata]|nr:dihydroorotase, homodimeric type [Syncephalis plumigaleata]